MHPEIRQMGPGDCPICGMSLEPLIPELDEEENPELKDFSKRFWWSLPLTVAVTLLAMAGHAIPLFHGASQNWVELALTTPVVLWAGWPFFVRGFASVKHRSPNMWTLIGLGTGAAYIYSIVATVLPSIFPESFTVGGRIGVYYEAAAVIISLTLLGQLLELKARSDIFRNQVPAWLITQNSSPYRQGWFRGGHPAHTCSRGRPSARSSW